MSNTYNVRVQTQTGPVVKVTNKPGIGALNPVELHTLATVTRVRDLQDVSLINATSGAALIYNSNTQVFTVRQFAFTDLAGSSLSLNSISANVGDYANLTATLFQSNTANIANLSVTSVYANGSAGSNGQILTSNGTSTYWSNQTPLGVTNVATSNGLTGGPITSTGTIGLVVGSTLLTNSTGLHVKPSLTIQDLILTGNLTVQGTTTTVDTNSLLVKDNMIGLGSAQANTGTFLDVVDAGFYSVFGNTSATMYAGLARIASLSSNTNPYFKLFSSNTSPDVVIDTDASLGTLAAKLAAPGLTANSSAVTITANTTFQVAITANTLQFDILDCGTYS